MNWLGLSVHEWVFGILSFLSIFFSLLVIFSRSPVNSVIYLVLTFFSISGHYLLLNAQFLAVVNIVVYAGAIMVLFLFIIMLINLNEDNEPQKTWLTKLIAGVSGGLLLLTLLRILKGSGILEKQYNIKGYPQSGDLTAISQVLFTDYLFPFEIISVLLLAAMVGAIYLGKKEITGEYENGTEEIPDNSREETQTVPQHQEV